MAKFVVLLMGLVFSAQVHATCEDLLPKANSPSNQQKAAELHKELDQYARSRVRPNHSYIREWTKRAEPLLPYFTPNALIENTQSLIYLTHDLGPEFITSWKKAVADQLNVFSAKSLAEALECYTKLLAPGEKADFAFLAKWKTAADQKINELRAFDAVIILGAFARMDIKPDELTIQKLVEIIKVNVRSLGRFQSTLVIYAFGHLGIDPGHDLLKYILASLELRTEDLTPIKLFMTIKGLTLIGRPEAMEMFLSSLSPEEIRRLSAEDVIDEAVEAYIYFSKVHDDEFALLNLRDSGAIKFERKTDLYLMDKMRSQLNAKKLSFSINAEAPSGHSIDFLLPNKLAVLIEDASDFLGTLDGSSLRKVESIRTEEILKAQGYDVWRLNESQL